MIDELVETIVPGGAILAAGVALGAAFSKQLRPVAKEAIKLGMVAGTAVQEAAAEVYERGQDLVAEARYEHEQEQAGGRETAGPAERAEPAAPAAPAAPAGTRGSERRPRTARGARE